MSYHAVKLNLTKAQQSKLRNGHTIQLKPEHMRSSSHTVYLTQQQINRMKKALEMKKGMRLTMSPTQHKHNRLHGGGFWDMLKSGASAILKNPTVQNMASNLLKDGAHWALNKAGSAIQNKTGFDTSGITNFAKSHVGNLADAIVDKTLSAASKHLSGSGVVSNVLGSIPIIGSFLGPIASMFGGKMSNAKALRIAKASVHAHMKDHKGVRHHMKRHVIAHLKGLDRKRKSSKKSTKKGSKRMAGGSFHF